MKSFLKYIYIFFALLSMSNLSYCQNGIEVIYNEKNKIDSAKLEKLPNEIRKNAYELLSKEIEGKLTHIDNISTYTTTFKTDKTTKSKKTENSEEISTHISQGNSFWYKDFSINTYYSKTKLFDEDYLINDSINRHWQIIAEYQKIDSFKCQKAILTFANKVVIAWFTEEIPISDGPEFYGGLPGLILKIELPKKIFYATKIKYSNFSIKLAAKPFGGKPVSQSEFYSIINSKFDSRNTKTEIEKVGNTTRTHSTILY